LATPLGRTQVTDQKNIFIWINFLRKTPSVQIFAIAQKMNCSLLKFGGCSPSARLRPAQSQDGGGRIFSTKRNNQ